MFIAQLKTVGIILLATAIGVHARETHTVHFTNKCGHGTPTLLRNGKVLSTGGDYVSDGSLISAIAYLQTGACGLNGEHCTTVETTLVNPTTAGSGSSTDITLIPPHSFSVTTGFGYYNGCNGAGADCTKPDCPAAFESSDQTWKQVACQVDNVDLAITFCD